MSGHGFDALTDKEKEVLRLLSQGFDVKGCARELDVTDGSVTERLRVIRKKLNVTSSREAARLLAQHEMEVPRKSGYRNSGIAQAQFRTPNQPAPEIQAQAGPHPDMYVRKGQIPFKTFADTTVQRTNLPLRKPGEDRNTLGHRERLYAIVDISTKLAGVFALVCLIAILVNNLTESV